MKISKLKSLGVSLFFVLYLSGLYSFIFADQSNIVKNSDQPVIDIIYPPENYYSYKEEILFKGKAKNTKHLFINSKKIALKKNGDFFLTLPLPESATYNKFIIRAISKYGKIKEVKRRIYFNPQKGLLPEIELISPEKGFISSKKHVVFKGNTKNTKQLTINGNIIKMDDKGNFFFYQPLKKNNRYQYYVIQATSDSGAHYHVSRAILYKEESLTKKNQKKNTASEVISIKGPSGKGKKEKTPSASIVLDFPPDNYVSDKQMVIFKGQTNNIKKLAINGNSIRMNDKGAFFFYQKIQQPYQVHKYTLKAVSNTNETYQLLRNISYSDMSFQKPVIKNTILARKSKTAKTKKMSVTKTNKYVPEIKKTETKNSKAKPFIELFSPQKKLITSDDTVLFTGKAKNITSLKINNKTVPVKSNGTFHHVSKLTKPNSINSFTISAKSKDNNISSIKRNIFYKVKKESAASKKTVKTDKKNIKVKTAAKTKQNLKPKPEKIVQTSKKIKIKSEDKNKKISSKAESSIPVISIKTPENNFITYKDRIHIQGKIKNAEEFFINSRVVTLSSDGSFDEVFDINTKGKHIFNLHAIGRNSLNTSLIRKVFRVDRNKPTKNQKKKKKKNTLQERLNKKITLESEDADIKEVLKVLSRKSGLNIVSDSSLTGQVNIYLKDTTIVSAIEYVLNTQGLSYKIIDNTIIVAPSQKLKLPTKIVTKIIKLQNIKVTNTVEIIKKQLAPEESVQALDQDNLLIINADAQKIEYIEKIISRIDQKKIPQIMIIAQIVEVSSTALQSLGISWPQNLSLGLAEGATLDEPGYTFSISAAVISALQEQGKAKILAKPQIKVLHEQNAEIFIGDKIPYIELTTDASGRLTESVKFADTGITLQILPYINPDSKEIQLKIEPEVSYINGYRGRNNDIPILRTRKVSTTVSIIDGSTAIIGGLFNSSDASSKSKLPILGDLPLLGNLFTGGRDEDSQTELVITVTVSIVKDKLEEDTTETKS
ncbi:MAG: hypothetical protein GY730_07535 [bacterium]|nr:hypothetical protein [bacterium]